MNRIFFTLVAFFSLLCSANSQSISIMSFNIRLATGDDAPYHWSARQPAVDYLLSREKPMLLGVQEALHEQVLFLDSLLTGYNREGVGRDNGATEGEYSAIYYQSKYFERLDSGTFWLSETPCEVSFGWDAACRRVVTWVKLRDKRSGKEFCYMNTHFDHQGVKARQNSSTLICEKIKEIAGDMPTFVSGDFNAVETEDPIVYILKSGALVDSRKIAKSVKGRENTFHGFKEKVAGVIDYIFVTRGIDIKSSEIIEYRYNGIYLSDHNPVLMRAKL